MVFAFNRVVPVLVLVAIPLAGCGPKQTNVLGKAPESTSTIQVRQLAAKTGSVVTLQGEMVEKCPVAGCWFMLRDKTGIVRVDTKQAGFVVSEVPLHTRMTVTGTVAAGSESAVKASGVRY